MHDPKILIKPPKHNDVSGWLTLPFDAKGSMKYISRTAARPLRHDRRIERDSEQGVYFDKLYGYMYEALVGYDNENQIVKSDGSLIDRMIQG